MNYYIGSLWSTAIMAAAIRILLAFHQQLAFIVNVRYQFHLILALGLAIYFGKKKGKWNSLLLPQQWGIQILRSTTLFGQTVGLYAQAFFIPIATGNSLVLAHRTLFVLLLAPVFKEKVEKKAWVAASVLVTLLGVVVMFISTSPEASKIFLTIGATLFGTKPTGLHQISALLPQLGAAMWKSFSGGQSSLLFYGWLAVILNTCSTGIGMHSNRAAALGGENKFTTLYLSALVGVFLTTLPWFTGITRFIPELHFPAFSGDDGIRSGMWLSVLIVFAVLAQYFQQVAAHKLETTLLMLIAPLQIPFGALLDYVVFHKVPNVLAVAAMLILAAGSLLGLPAMKEAERKRKEAKRLARAERRLLMLRIAYSSKIWRKFISKPRFEKFRLIKV